MLLLCTLGIPEEIRKEQAGEGEGCWPNDFIVSSHPGNHDNRLLIVTRARLFCNSFSAAGVRFAIKSMA